MGDHRISAGIATLTPTLYQPTLSLTLERLLNMGNFYNIFIY